MVAGLPKARTPTRGFCAESPFFGLPGGTASRSCRCRLSRRSRGRWQRPLGRSGRRSGVRSLRPGAGEFALRDREKGVTAFLWVSPPASPIVLRGLRVSLPTPTVGPENTRPPQALRAARRVPSRRELVAVPDCTGGTAGVVFGPYGRGQAYTGDSCVGRPRRGVRGDRVLEDLPDQGEPGRGAPLSSCEEYTHADGHDFERQEPRGASRGRWARVAAPDEGAEPGGDEPPRDLSAAAVSVSTNERGEGPISVRMRLQGGLPAASGSCVGPLGAFLAIKWGFF